MQKQAQEKNDILEYKNQWLFYQNLYQRLFKLIRNMIDENKYNIRVLKDEMIDFTDTYSYYIIGKSEISIEDTNETHKETDESILKSLEGFDSFTENLKGYPSENYKQIRRQLINTDYDLTKLSEQQFIDLLKEYYEFFEEMLNILKRFIDIASNNGFLPNIKNKSAMKNIGFANYDYFFQELENLKTTMSELTTSITVRNMFKCRRCIYSILVVFSPYFKRKKIFNQLTNELDFSFINDREKMRLIRATYSYETFDRIPSHKQESVLEILNPLKRNISLIKRYMSYEFGEIDMSPRLKKKYNFDPTWT